MVAELGQNHLQAGKMGGPGKSAGAGKAAGDALGAKGSKEPKKAPRSRPTAAEKDVQKLNELHMAAKGDWLKAQWKEYAELQKKVATVARTTYAKPCVKLRVPSDLEGRPSRKKKRRSIQLGSDRRDTPLVAKEAFSGRAGSGSGLVRKELVSRAEGGGGSQNPTCRCCSENSGSVGT